MIYTGDFVKAKNKSYREGNSYVIYNVSIMYIVKSIDKEKNTALCVNEKVPNGVVFPLNRLRTVDTEFEMVSNLETMKYKYCTLGTGVSKMINSDKYFPV